MIDGIRGFLSIRTKTLHKKYQNKNILIITHEDAGWGLFSVVNGLNKNETLAEEKNRLANAEI